MTTDTAKQPLGGRAIDTKDFLVPSDTLGIALHVRNKRLASAGPFPAKRTILMVHGATFSSESVFDVPLDGVSFMEDLASHGYDVYALDVRGYGGSTRPPEMDRPADESAPIVRTETAVRDLASAVAYLQDRLGGAPINLLGMSWGGTLAGAYASRNNGNIQKLILVAPQWLTTTPPPIDKGDPLGAYRVIPIDAIEERWLAGAPAGKRADLIPKDGFAQWAEATIATDPWNAAHATRTVRAPSGAVQDIREFWTAGKPFYNPGDLTSPTLLIHGEWDVDAPIDITLNFFTSLTGARYKRWIEIGEATHMVLLEKNRGQAYDAARVFLDEEY